MGFDEGVLDTLSASSRENTAVSPFPGSTFKATNISDYKDSLSNL